MEYRNIGTKILYICNMYIYIYIHISMNVWIGGRRKAWCIPLVFVSYLGVALTRISIGKKGRINEGLERKDGGRTIGAERAADRGKGKTNTRKK
jgi:hypothetical protein